MSRTIVLDEKGQALLERLLIAWQEGSVFLDDTFGPNKERLPYDPETFKSLYGQLTRRG